MVCENHMFPRTIQYAATTLITLMLSGLSVLGADTGIKILTTLTTNQSGAVHAKSIFTRDGETNLVYKASTKSGIVQIRIHSFYHGGLLVGEFISTPDSSGFTVEAGSPYSMSFEFGPSQTVKSAVIGTKDGVMLDAFMATNSVFYPVESSTLRKANDVGSDVKQVLSPTNITNKTSDEFQREVQQLIEKREDH